MIWAAKPCRAFVASFTAVWTSVLCCCAIFGHGAAATAAAAPHDVSAAYAQADPHACCQAPVLPQDTPPADPIPADADAGHDCSCDQQSKIKINPAGHQALPPLTMHGPLLDLLPLTTLSLLDPPAATFAHPCAQAPPVLPCAQSLLAQACMLTT